MKQAIIDKADKALKGIYPIILLRGNDAQARIDGDIDFLVPFGKSNDATLRLIDTLRSEGWRVLSYRDIGYLTTFTVVNLVGVNSHSIKIDVFNGLSWRGLGNDRSNHSFFEDLLLEKNSEQDLINLVATINFLHKSMYAGRLSERDILRLDCDWPTVKKVSDRLGWGVSECSFPGGPGTIGKWGLRFRSANITTGLSAVTWFFKLLKMAVSSRLGIGFDSGIALSLSGMDGSGKTTQFERMLSWYKKSGTSPPRTIHFLPSWIPLPHQIFKRTKTISNYTAPYSEPPTRSGLSRAVRMVWYALAFALCKLYVSSLARIGKVVFLDRSFVDLAADMDRVKIPHMNLSQKVLNFFSLNGLNIYLDASPKDAVARKGELSIDRALLLQSRYIDIFNKIGGNRVNGDLSKDQVSAQLLDLIDRQYRKRIQAKVAKGK